MPELRSMLKTNRWHIVHEGYTPCRIPQPITISPFVLTLTDEELTTIAQTNQVPSTYYDKPGILCRRCVKVQYPHLYQTCVSAEHATTPKAPAAHNPHAANNIAVNLRLDPNIVDKAKIVAAARLGTSPQAISFSALAVIALDTYGDRLRDNLRKTGLVKSTPVGRPRLIQTKTWEEITEITQEYGISGTTAIRAILQMFADDTPTE